MAHGIRHVSKWSFEMVTTVKKLVTGWQWGGWMGGWADEWTAGWMFLGGSVIFPSDEVLIEASLPALGFDGLDLIHVFTSRPLERSLRWHTESVCTPALSAHQ